MSDSTRLAREVVQALVDAGVREAVLSPGSRNAPLSFALLDAERAGALRLHVRIDERSAGFLALGMSRASGRPVAVSCTSGTAVANLAPAVLEAKHGDAQLLVLAADRPLALRGTSASQTTVQPGLLPAPVADLAEAAEVRPALAPLLAAGGPVHLNLQFGEPLTPDDAFVPVLASAPGAAGVTAARARRTSTRLQHGPRTVVVAGDGAGARARLVAERSGWPLLAEPSSEARGGPSALRAYRLLLGTELGEEVERVVLLGHPTLSRPVSRLLSRADVEVVDLDPRWSPRPFEVALTVDDLAVEENTDAALLERDADWLAAWRTADWELCQRLDAFVAEREGISPYAVAATVAASLGGSDLLFVGPSNPVRDLDLMAPVRGRGPLVLANRGLAGIDGVVSSAIGAALAAQSEGRGRAVALVGDVTFLHDSGGLVIGPDEPRPDLTVVVVNDDGGSIFHGLEQGEERHAHAFERVFGTPHGVDLASLCAATRTPHWRVESRLELEHALAQPAGGIEVVEVVVRRDDRREVDALIWQLARRA